MVKDQFTEPVTTSFGPMVQLHALLRFDRPVRERIEGKELRRIAALESVSVQSVSKRLITASWGEFLQAIGCADAGLYLASRHAGEKRVAEKELELPPGRGRRPSTR